MKTTTQAMTTQTMNKKNIYENCESIGEVVATLEQDVEEWREKAIEAQTKLSACTYANRGAEIAAQRIVALEQENAAIKQYAMQLQQEITRLRHKCKQQTCTKS